MGNNHLGPRKRERPGRWYQHEGLLEDSWPLECSYAEWLRKAQSSQKGKVQEALEQAKKVEAALVKEMVKVQI